MLKKLNLLCDTNQMAYGSSSALLAILEFLNSNNTAFAWGVTKEILSTDKYIHCIIELDNKNSDLVKAVIDNSKFDAVIVISNLNNIETYLDAKIPLFYLDLHHWYPTIKSNPVWTEAKKCFIENFLDFNLKPLPNAINVGPVIKLNNRSVQKEKTILINIGGGENRWIKPGENSSYLSLVINLLSDFFCEKYDYNIYVAAGKLAVASIGKLNLPSNVCIKTFPQDEYLEILGKAEYLFTSPGLNAVFEGMYFGSKIVFLPPQNASQILQLEYYEKAKLVHKGLNIKDLINDQKELDYECFDEKALTFYVLESLLKINENSVFMNLIIEHIKVQIANLNLCDYHEKIQNLIESLGDPGAKTIAQNIEYYFENEKNN